MQERSSIWTIPKGEITPYLGLFTILNLIGMVFIIWYDLSAGTGKPLSDTIRGIVLSAGPITAGSAGISLTIIETLRLLMVIASFFREKLLEPQREKYRKQGADLGEKRGREQTQKEWRAWNNRRLDAESQGEPFDEPPPGED